MAISFFASKDWLEEYHGQTDKSAEDVAVLLGLHAFEIEDMEEQGSDTIIEVDVLPNRSSDSLSHRGIARELSSITGVALARDPLATPPDLSQPASKISLTIENSADCARFTAAVIEGVKVKESPKWLKERLEAMGQRSINNVVDATNYVMFAIGQPTHAFDYDKLAKHENGVANITVRRGKEGEVCTLLTGEVIESNENILHLADGVSGELLDLAGIKGGQAAELTKDTTAIAITSGNFNYQLVRKTSQKLKIFTDASQRFQNEPSPELAGFGLAETVKLILEIAGGELDGYVDEYPSVRPIPTTLMSPKRCNTLLGLELSVAEMTELIQRTGATVEVTAEGMLSCTAPWERTDLNIEEDYIEEVGRLYGYENIKSAVPERQSLTEVNKRHYYSDKIRRLLTEKGFSEVITSSFRKKDKIQLQNALASDKSYLRSSLHNNITEALEKNAGFADLLGVPDTRIFEIGTVFAPQADGQGIAEHVSLALGVRTKKKAYSPKDDEILALSIEQLKQVLETDVQVDMHEGVAELNLTTLLAQLPDPSAYEPVEVGKEIVYQPFSVYQHVSRDIAMWVNSVVEVKTIAALLGAHGTELCRRITLIDQFEKDSRTSYAFRMVFQSNERTLTDAEVNTIMEGVYKAVAEAGWEVR